VYERLVALVAPFDVSEKAGEAADSDPVGWHFLGIDSCFPPASSSK
jgi:hypothetical protein